MSEPEIGFRAPLPEELAPLFPKYQILSLIATGGMGAVYHAVQTALEREVALKILPVEFGKDPEFCEGFGAEARAMAKLNHPNLIGVYDYGDVNGMLFIVMEYVSGQSLHEACNGIAVDSTEVIRLMTGICHGLAHAHGQGILHRDIKPANILLDSQLQPKIGDFGLARPLDAQVGEGEAIFGTPGYTAPEVLDAPHTIDQRADIFALGILMHELLTGLLPGSDPRPPSVIAHCDPRFDLLVRKATHPDPQQRYQTAAEISDALQKIASTPAHKALRTASPAAPRKPAAPRYSSVSEPPEKSSGGLVGTMIAFAVVVALFIFKDRILNMANPGPDPVPAPIVEHKPEPVKPVEVIADPEPVNPLPNPSPEPVNPEPEPQPVVSVPQPVIPEPAPEPESKPEPEPEPVVSAPVTNPGDSVPVNTPQPKFDVEGFLARARSVMITRCVPDIANRDQALGDNLLEFRREGVNLAKTNIQEVYQQALEKELDTFIAKCKADGNRLSEKLDGPLKFKKWLVELHGDFKSKEEEIDGEMMRAFSAHQKTYLQGLGIRINALREGDPVAADLIKDELDKVNASPDYFADLMLKEAK